MCDIINKLFLAIIMRRKLTQSLQSAVSRRRRPQPPPKYQRLKKFLLWFYGVLLLLFALSALANSVFFSVLLFTIAGIMLLPPAFKKHNLTQKQASVSAAILSVIALVWLGANNPTPTQPQPVAPPTAQSLMTDVTNQDVSPPLKNQTQSSPEETQEQEAVLQTAQLEKTESEQTELEKTEAQQQEQVAQTEPTPKAEEDTSSEIDERCFKSPRCKELRSCKEAKFFLNTCGHSNLDRDDDGIPCESLCR